MIDVAKEMTHWNKLAKGNPGKRFAKLWNSMTDITWIIQAWKEIEGNKGSRTPGVDKKTKTDVTELTLQRLADKLKEGTYWPTPVKRAYIPKANGKLRPLGIPTIEDRIVQQALKMVLEPIFEADFYSCSHGFRQNRSPITALRQAANGQRLTSWTIEGDIQGCFDNIPHGKLMEQLNRRIADEKILQLCWRFLKAGYLENWKYHGTYSGTPQGGIASPLLANIYLHQLDEFMMKMGANRIESKKEQNSRRNPEYRRVENKITRLREILKEDGRSPTERREIIDELNWLEKKQKATPHLLKKHKGEIRYVRYADDFIIQVAKGKEEAQAIKDRVGNKLAEMGPVMSKDKTKLSHWSDQVRFLGYHLHGKLRKRGQGLKSILSIPKEKLETVIQKIEEAGGYHHIPMTDLIVQINAITRGWCNYYRYASAPQKVFSNVMSKTWWTVAHYKARNLNTSIRQMLIQEKKTGRYATIEKKGRRRKVFLQDVGNKTITLDLFAPKTGDIWRYATKQWEVDLKPILLANWKTGHSLQSQLETKERTNGLCERCETNPIEHIHHTSPLRAKGILARIQSDRDQQKVALCKECHLKAHGGSFAPRKRSWNAGCAERHPSGVGTASWKPIAERQ